MPWFSVHACDRAGVSTSYTGHCLQKQTLSYALGAQGITVVTCMFMTKPNELIVDKTSTTLTLQIVHQHQEGVDSNASVRVS